MGKHKKKPVPPTYILEPEKAWGSTVHDIWRRLKDKGWIQDYFLQYVFKDYGRTTFVKGKKIGECNIPIDQVWQYSKALGYPSLFHFLKSEHFALLHKHNPLLYRELTAYVRNKNSRDMANLKKEVIKQSEEIADLKQKIEQLKANANRQ